MPFDVTTNKASFQIVSRIGGGDPVIGTHWSYWSKDCRHLADVFICLTHDDTVVVDPTALQGEIQSPNPPTNTKTGPVINLSGELGMVTVTAFTVDTGASGLECRIADDEYGLMRQRCQRREIGRLRSRRREPGPGKGDRQGRVDCKE